MLNQLVHIFSLRGDAHTLTKFASKYFSNSCSPSPFLGLKPYVVVRIAQERERSLAVAVVNRGSQAGPPRRISQRACLRV